MLSKNKIKFIASLHKKKYRQKYNKFIVEGQKIINDIASSNYLINEIYTSNKEIAEKYPESILIDNNQMKKISALTNPSDILAVVEIPEQQELKKIPETMVLCLSDIQDPGNFGTIIRTADWFGIKTIVCSLNTVELYNPKTIQATMGAFVNINIYYTCLSEFLKNNKDKTIYGTYMNGKNIYKTEINNNSIIILGNEGNGISKNIEKFIDTKITIPAFNENKKAESLNVSIATAIVLSEIKRK
jgi:TrmH family RNA methyltransferase